MGSASTENIQGRTEYATESVSADGNEVRGTFVRDGTRRGSFVMRRAGQVFVMGSKQARHRQAGAATAEKRDPVVVVNWLSELNQITPGTRSPR